MFSDSFIVSFSFIHDQLKKKTNSELLKCEFPSQLVICFSRQCISLCKEFHIIYFPLCLTIKVKQQYPKMVVTTVQLFEAQNE